MRISIITPTLNQAEFIGRTIDSVLSQRGDFDLDYGVVDGGSSDGTLAILERYGSDLRWASAPDRGQIDAINKGLADADGDILAWINSDDLLLPGALAKVARLFRDSSECQWAHGDCRIIDRNDREIRKWVSAYKRYYARRFSHKSLLSRNFISQMSVFWRRELMDRVGLLDPAFSLAFDYDYWLRMSAVCQPQYIDSPIAAFRWHESSKSSANTREQIAEDELIAQKHGARSAAHRYWKRLQNQLRLGAYRTADLIAATRVTDSSERR